MQQIIDLIGINCLALIFVTVIVEPFKFKYWWEMQGERKVVKRLKPFDCVGCLSFWIALIYFPISFLPAIAYVTGYVMEIRIIGIR